MPMLYWFPFEPGPPSVVLHQGLPLHLLAPAHAHTCALQAPCAPGALRNLSNLPPAAPLCRAAFQALKASGAGVIINISMTLHYGATWYQTHASAAKVGRTLNTGVRGGGSWARGYLCVCLA